MACISPSQKGKTSGIIASIYRIHMQWYKDYNFMLTVNRIQLKSLNIDGVHCLLKELIKINYKIIILHILQIRIQRIWLYITCILGFHVGYSLLKNAVVIFETTDPGFQLFVFIPYVFYLILQKYQCWIFGALSFFEKYSYIKFLPSSQTRFV